MPFLNPLNAFELIEQEPDFIYREPVESDTWKAVRVQAGHHMRREGVTFLYDIQRPNEPEEVRDYRQTVQRDLTAEGTWKFLSKVTRVFLDNGIRPDEENMSPQMLEWLTNSFFVTGTKQFDVEEFMYQVLLPFMIEDPNGFLVAFPINEAAPDIAPATPPEFGGLSPLDRVGIRNFLISSVDVVFLSDNIMAWKAGKMEYKKGKKADYFYVVDDLNFVIYFPVEVANNKLEYRAEIWYFHGLGFIPVQQMGGILTRHEEQPHVAGEMIYYYESFLRPYFNYADEFMTSFSDNQAIRIQHAYPKMVMDPIPCPNPDCRDGRVKILDPESGEPVEIRDCPICRGAKYLTNPGPYTTLIRDRKPGVENNSPVLEYVSPPTDILQHSYDICFDLLLKGKKSIGLDLLENVLESGVAKSMRLDDLRDFLWQIASNISRVMENHLRSVEGMLNIRTEEQIEPTVFLPQVIHFTNRSLLKEEAETAIPSDKRDSALAYLRQKYRDDDVKFLIHQLAFRFAPLLLLDAAETSQAMAVGAYSSEDIIKRDRAIDIFTEIAEKIGRQEFLSADEDALLEVAGYLIIPYLPVQETGLFDVPVADGQEAPPGEGAPIDQPEEIEINA